MPTNAKTAAQVIGESLRALRVDRGLRQDEIAADARAHGLPWTRATIAALETGRRELKTVELWVLPWLYEVEIADLVNAPVQIAPGVTMPVHLARAAASGQARKKAFGSWAAEPRADSGDFSERLMHRVVAARRLSQVWPDASEVDVDAAANDSRGEVETRAARRLGVEPMALALAARRRWGRSLTAERNHRTPEGVTKQGHITRALLEELRPDLEAAGVLKTQRRRSKKEG